MGGFGVYADALFNTSVGLAGANPVALALAGLPTAPRPWDGTFSPPIGPPTPPLFPLLDATGRQQFDGWKTGRESGISGGLPDDEAYQRRVAGSSPSCTNPRRGRPCYPEYKLPAPGGGVAVHTDGLRTQDGAAIEAKHVRDPDCTPRTLDAVQQSKEQPWLQNMYMKDDREMAGYSQALRTSGTPVKFVEVNTDNQESVGYWDYMLAKHHVKGYSRYTP